jgi:hypothetical protein
VCACVCVCERVWCKQEPFSPSRPRTREVSFPTHITHSARAPRPPRPDQHRSDPATLCVHSAPGPSARARTARSCPDKFWDVTLSSESSPPHASTRASAPRAVRRPPTSSSVGVFSSSMARKAPMSLALRAATVAASVVALASPAGAFSKGDLVKVVASHAGPVNNREHATQGPRSASRGRAPSRPLVVGLPAPPHVCAHCIFPPPPFSAAPRSLGDVQLLRPALLRAQG